MKQPLLSKSALWMGLAVAIGLGTILWIWWDRQGHTIRQAARLKLAAEHLPIVEQIVLECGAVDIEAVR